MSNLINKSISFEINDKEGAGYVPEITVNAGKTIDLSFKMTNIAKLSLSFKLSSDEDEDTEDIAISEEDWGDVSWEPKNSSMKWKGVGEMIITPPADQQKEFHFKIKNFKVFDKAGTAEILVFESSHEMAPLKINKIKDDAPFIKSFEADKYFTNQNTAVTLHWDAKNVTKFELYQDKELILQTKATSYEIKSLTTSSNYKLKGYNEQNTKQPAASAELYLTAYKRTEVNTATQQFPPNSRILGIYPATDENEMYALVQKEDEDEATLYKSTSNILQLWRQEYVYKETALDEESAIQPATIPLDLATRPGLLFDHKLWLIGGSTYDPDATNNTHGYIDLRTKKWVDKGIIRYNDADMLPRMGHACVLHDRKIWVIGGHNPDHIAALKDIWVFDGANWEKIKQELPTGKCMMAACNRIFNKVVNPSDKQQNKQDEQIWLFGGYEDMPGGKRSFKFYCMNKGETFELIQTTLHGAPLKDYNAVSMVADEAGKIYLFIEDVYQLYFDDKWYLDFRSNNSDWHYNVKGHYLQTAAFLKSIWINAVHFPRGEAFEEKRGHLSYGFFVK